MSKAGSGKREAMGGGGRSSGDKRWFYVLVAVLLVGGIATLSYVSLKPRAQSVWVIDSAVALVPNQGHVIGSDSAMVEVIEFGDFECPGCGRFATITEPDVRTRLVNTGLIRFRFMDFPLNIHRNTRFAHSAAWCAGEQGKFWEMHDLIYLNQDRWNGEATRRPDDVLAQFARQIGLNMPQYETCVRTRKYAGQIQANFDEAIRLKVPSTPTFLFGQKMVSEVLPYDSFKRHSDTLLAQARKTTK